MNFTVSSTLLCSRLQSLSRVIAPKNTLQILDCILFDLRDGKLQLTASDSETTLVTSIDVQEADGNGMFAIKAVTIINSLKEIAEQPIYISVNESTKEIVVNYQNGRCNFIGQSGEEYPQPKTSGEGMQQMSLPADMLLQGISRAIFATGDNELRPVMNGVYLDITPESITFVASDGHKLVRDTYTTNTANCTAGFILPKKPGKTLKDILGRESGDAVITFDDRNAQVELENYTLSCRLIEGRYPNYNSVIPTDNPFSVTCDRTALLGALRRVIVFASSETALVKLQVDSNNLTISAQDIEFAKAAEEKVFCDYSGNPMSIGFKGPFLVDILNGINAESITLQLADPSRPGIIVPAENEENEDLLMLLMPMMLND